MDVSYFDTAFTEEPVKLTPIDAQFLARVNQTQFKGFSYTNKQYTATAPSWQQTAQNLTTRIHSENQWQHSIGDFTWLCDVWFYPNKCYTQTEISSFLLHIPFCNWQLMCISVPRVTRTLSTPKAISGWRNVLIFLFTHIFLYQNNWCQVPRLASIQNT